MEGPTAQQALTELQARAQGHLQRAVGQVLPALAAPEWPVAVVAAASALVAGRAEAAAAQRLIAEVQPHNTKSECGCSECICHIDWTPRAKAQLGNHD